MESWSSKTHSLGIYSHILRKCALFLVCFKRRELELLCKLSGGCTVGECEWGELLISGINRQSRLRHTYRQSGPVPQKTQYMLPISVGGEEGAPPTSVDTETPFFRPLRQQRSCHRRLLLRFWCPSDNAFPRETPLRNHIKNIYTHVLPATGRSPGHVRTTHHHGRMTNAPK